MKLLRDLFWIRDSELGSDKLHAVEPSDVCEETHKIYSALEYFQMIIKEDLRYIYVGVIRDLGISRISLLIFPHY